MPLPLKFRMLRMCLHGHSVAHLGLELMGGLPKKSSPEETAKRSDRSTSSSACPSPSPIASTAGRSVLATTPTAPALAMMASRPELLVSPVGPILVVDDNPVNILVLSQFLEMLGYPTIHTATGGEQAIEMCAQHDYRLVLMDMVMPEMSGAAAATAIAERARAAQRTGPLCVAVTAEPLLVEDNQIFAAVLDKPVSPEKLALLLERILPAVDRPVSPSGPDEPASKRFRMY
jgi:CheY-like chemotaxis protein